MPELTVSLSLWIASQISGFVCVAFSMYAFQIKRKANTILAIGIANIFLATSLALLQNWVVFSLISVAAIRSFVFYFIELRAEKGKEIKPVISFLLMIIFMIISIIPVIFTQTWWFDWVLLGCSLFIIFGNWAKGIHLFRLGCMSYDSLVVVNHIKYFNIIGLIQSALLVGAVIVFYIRFFLTRRRIDTHKL
jgi:hypothetical protein